MLDRSEHLFREQKRKPICLNLKDRILKRPELHSRCDGIEEAEHLISASSILEFQERVVLGLNGVFLRGCVGCLSSAASSRQRSRQSDHSSSVLSPDEMA